MNCIKTITDMDILGTAGMSNAKPRLTARAVLKNNQGYYAVMYASEFRLHSLPGGGVDGDENLEEALKREVMEETGCTCDKIVPLGYVEENRAHQDYTTVSYYFAVDTQSQELNPSLTQEEKKHGTTVSWYTFEEAYDRIANAEHTTTQRKFLQARDVAALEAYKSSFLGK